MTRLENQIKEATEKLENLIKFSNEKKAIYESKKAEIQTILKKYKSSIIDDSNMWVDYGVTDSSKMYLRIYLKITDLNLKPSAKKLLEFHLRNIVPMPIGGVGVNTIELVYYDKE